MHVPEPKWSLVSTNRWGEDGECEDRYRNPGKIDGLEPALPIGKRLVDKLLVIVGSKVGRVMLEALYYKLTLFGSEELCCRWILTEELVICAR